jgi:DNA-binding transcriptional regulator GbsR (MarR family)
MVHATMNHMKKQASGRPASIRADAELKRLKSLADAVGNFIRYWGFRRIHGAIWTQIYLSSEPLSGAQIVKRLKVSKALVSPAISELEAWGLIVPSQARDEKSKFYIAEPDVFGVIRRVLATREKKLLDAVAIGLSDLNKNAVSDRIDHGRLQALDDMLQSAQIALMLLLGANDFESISQSLASSPPTAPLRKQTK